MPNHHPRPWCLPRREKVFGPAEGIPLDRNAKARIMVYAEGYNARHRRPRQHRGPITRAFMEVLQALLWGFHNSRDGRCFPSLKAIAARARCHRDTVCEAIKALEFAGIMTWVNRIVRERVRERDLFGQWAYRWRVVRTSNAYVFRDPLPCHEGRPSVRWRAPRAGETGLGRGFASKSENPAETLIPDLKQKDGLERNAAQTALAQVRTAFEARWRQHRLAIIA